MANDAVKQHKLMAAGKKITGKDQQTGGNETMRKPAPKSDKQKKQ